MPEKPLSLAHWIDSLNTVLLVASAIELAGAAGAGSTGGAGSAAKPAAPAGKFDTSLLKELANSNVKYNLDDIVSIAKTPEGKLVWLEKGTAQAGLNHIMSHAEEFVKCGISKEQIADFIMDALQNGTIIGYQGRGLGRPIYEVVFNGSVKRVAITTGENGFVVGANPVSLSN